jgi:hypothetical protein
MIQNLPQRPSTTTFSCALWRTKGDCQPSNFRIIRRKTTASLASSGVKMGNLASTGTVTKLGTGQKPTTFKQNTTLGVIAMLKDIVAVSPQPGYQLDLRFEDGIAGRLNISQLIEFSGIFEPLQDFDYFAQVRVNPELGTIEWPNEADLDPDVLYALLTGQTIHYEPNYFPVAQVA